MLRTWLSIVKKQSNSSSPGRRGSALDKIKVLIDKISTESFSEGRAMESGCMWALEKHSKTIEETKVELVMLIKDLSEKAAMYDSLCK